ncbi:MAG: hypothetical protein RMZ41_010615 [Nostoc sp. DedVER02]|uniref:hypothetical protein n=1 Tax=unclassified Nostoc TaxID=2593658 RepID=UPI002AD3BA16|nr:MULTISPECIES: hypothetical protein [unclassified Nostoc]MDZ7986309.1 hypothetical protein [Nostoc sp. DedVER02]MDZ8112699.1 hypothetical protein [Nostoc sp. DedVER01b]
MFYFPAEYFLQVYSLPLIAEVKFQNDYFSEYPEQIRVGSDDTAVSYTRKSGYYAIHYNQPKTIAPGAILQLDGAMSTTGYAYAVFSGEPNSSEQNKLSPIYTLQPNGSLAVPTGLVFIRFAEGVDVESQHEVINQAGYEVVQILDYAPHGAWLRARSGNIADAIAKIPQLEAIPKVENIEPQMLMERGLRLER